MTNGFKARCNQIQKQKLRHITSNITFTKSWQCHDMA